MKSLIKKILPSFLLSWYYFLLAFFGSVIYGFPSRQIKVIGVTGTNGKTTVVSMAANVLEEAGYKVALLSSIKFKIGYQEKVNALKMTMPGRFKLQKFLRQAVAAGCQYAVLEVSSEGVKQYRHKFIDFTTAVFTNLTPEHIEAHGGFEKYRDAKAKFFAAVKKIHIINIDDKNANFFLKIPAEKIYTYGMEKGDINRRNTSFQLSLLGEFNIYNALAAISVGLSQGLSLEVCQRAVEKIKNVPGRMEIVIQEPFKVVVDYAVTPDALEGLYKTIKNEFSPNSLICVFGACGGGRDKWKRPELGKIASKYCNEIILTNEDPYSENPSQILSQIKSGIFNFSAIGGSALGGQFSISNLYEILDRREAISKALALAKPGDAVAISGKGAEPQMALAHDKKIPWDDRAVIKEEFACLPAGRQN